MGKFTGMIIFFSILITVFHVFGLIPSGSTPNSAILNLMLNPETIKTSPLSLNVILVLETLGVVTAVVATILLGNKIEYAISSLVTLYLINIGWDVVAVFNVISQHSRLFAILICGPIFILFVLTAFDFWRGRD